MTVCQRPVSWILSRGVYCAVPSRASWHRVPTAHGRAMRTCNVAHDVSVAPPGTAVRPPC